MWGGGGGLGVTTFKQPLSSPEMSFKVLRRAEKVQQVILALSGPSLFMSRFLRLPSSMMFHTQRVRSTEHVAKTDPSGLTAMSLTLSVCAGMERRTSPVRMSAT